MLSEREKGITSARIESVRLRTPSAAFLTSIAT